MFCSLLRVPCTAVEFYGQVHLIKMQNPTPAWAALEKHYNAIKEVHMRTMFEKDPSRFETFK
jgi:hypothetical protein